MSTNYWQKLLLQIKINVCLFFHCVIGNSSDFLNLFLEWQEWCLYDLGECKWVAIKLYVKSHWHEPQINIPIPRGYKHCKTRMQILLWRKKKLSLKGQIQGKLDSWPKILTLPLLFKRCWTDLNVFTPNRYSQEVVLDQRSSLGDWKRVLGPLLHLVTGEMLTFIPWSWEGCWYIKSSFLIWKFQKVKTLKTYIAWDSGWDLWIVYIMCLGRERWKQPSPGRSLKPLVGIEDTHFLWLRWCVERSREHGKRLTKKWDDAQLGEGIGGTHHGGIKGKYFSLFPHFLFVCFVFDCVVFVATRGLPLVGAGGATL